MPTRGRHQKRRNAISLREHRDTHARHVKGRPTHQNRCSDPAPFASPCSRGAFPKKQNMRPVPGVVSKSFKVCDNSVFTRTYSRVRQQNAVTKSTNKLSMSSTEPSGIRGATTSAHCEKITIGISPIHSRQMYLIAQVFSCCAWTSSIHTPQPRTSSQLASFPHPRPSPPSLPSRKQKTPTSLATWHPRVRKSVRVVTCL